MTLLVKKLATDSELRKKVSERNYNKALEYEASILSKRRESFYRKLKECVINDFD